jgi:hypothetical protein
VEKLGRHEAAARVLEAVITATRCRAGGRLRGFQGEEEGAPDSPHRRVPSGGGAARRRSPEGGRRRTSAGERRWYKVRRRKMEEREGEKMSRECRSSPSISRCRRLERRWTEATEIGENCRQKRKGNGGRGDDLGHPGSIDTTRRTRTSRRTSWRCRFVKGMAEAAAPWRGRRWRAMGFLPSRLACR